MCGIAGWAKAKGEGLSEERLAAMSRCIVHRGPDDAGQHSGPKGGLAFRRLSLLDLQGGNQPCGDEQGRYWSVFNGEIYNHAELRHELRSHGHDIRGTGDAELIPHLYEQWGPDFLHRLRGMFALAVQDSRTGELFLARDRFGIKPLYWTTNAGPLVFASEVRALRAAGAVSDEPDPVAVWSYLSCGYVPDPATMWSGVQMLPAGHRLRFRDGVVRIEQWWSPRFSPAATADRAEVVDELLAVLVDSVEAHLVADVPVGCYLSSGVDSSLLAALARQQRDLQTFSIGFEGGAGALDELGAARTMAATLGTKHTEQVVTAAEYWDSLPRVVASQEEPLADPSSPALWFLARSASAEVKAVLSGEGADELFGGYPIYREPDALRAVGRLPAGARHWLGRLAGRLPEGRQGKGYLERATTPLERRFLGNVPIFSDDAKHALLRQPAEAEQLGRTSDLLQPLYAATASLDDLTRMQAASCQTWLPCSILMKADKMSMAHSLEVRVPYLDPKVFRAAASLPRRLRVEGQTTKVALRAVAERVLPVETARRPKLGFPVPFRSWLGGGVGNQVRELFAASEDPVLDRRALLQLLDDERRPDRQRRVWTVMIYLLWKQVQQDQAHDSLPVLGRM